MAGCGVGEQQTDPELLALRAPPEGSVQYAVFEGHMPCAACEQEKVALTLHQNADDQTPTTYVLERILVGAGDTRYVSGGMWESSVGTSWCAEGVVLSLVDETVPEDLLPEGSAAEPTPSELTTWLVLLDKVMVVLDGEREPLVGDAGHSYTLSRTE
jgi:hypothetical protein